MKKLLLIISAIVSLNAMAQTPDQNFDGTWPTNGLYPANDPLGWISTNVLTNTFANPANPTSVTQSTLNCNGGFSMKVATKSFSLGALIGFLPDTCGFAFTGTVVVQISGSHLVDGFPYNQRPTQITYCYNAQPVSSDTCGVGVKLWKWNGTSRTYVGTAKNLYSTPTSSMTNGTLTIAYTSTLTPDSMCIYVGSSYKFPSTGTVIRNRAKIGSVMYADNFVYPPGTVGVKENKISEIELKAYPNPANTTLYISTESSDAKTIEIIDLTGKILETAVFNDGKLKLDVTKYNTGLYFYRVNGIANQTLKTGKFNVNH